MVMFPTLAVGDVRASVGWYAEVLGFGTVFVLPGADGEPVLGHLRWRTYADVLLVPDEGGADSKRVKGAGVGVAPEEGPVTRPWNTREIVVEDPDGYRLVFFEPVDVERSFEEVMGLAKG